jgi:hypothetical protein
MIVLKSALQEAKGKKGKIKMWILEMIFSGPTSTDLQTCNTKQRIGDHQDTDTD